MMTILEWICIAFCVVAVAVDLIKIYTYRYLLKNLQESTTLYLLSKETATQLMTGLGMVEHPATDLN